LKEKVFFYFWKPGLADPTILLTWQKQNDSIPPLWFTHCCLTPASLYPHITETKTRFSNGRNTQALRLQHYNSSHVRSHSFATEQWQSAVNQVQSSKRWVEPNQGSVPNQCSNIRSFSGPSLPAHAKFYRSRHPKPRVLARRDFYSRSARIVIATHRSSKWKRECRPPQLPRAARFASLTPNFTNLTFLETVGVKKLFVLFSIFGFFWSQLTHPIRLVSSLLNILPTVLLGFFRQCLVYFSNVI